jgi:hypothetical protein
MEITDSKAPSFEQLRPLKSLTTSHFPVYPNLVDLLVGQREHPDDTVAHAMATCAGYAYSAPDTVAMIMARMGLAENTCHTIAETVDAMFIESTAFLVQSQDGRVVILAYRGTQPANFINWLTDADVHPEEVAIRLPGTDGAFDVHAGFYRNVRATRYEVVNALVRALNGQSVQSEATPVPHPLEALYVTGHSLGGAMAALMGVMLVTEEAYAPIAEKLRAVYTFGQPMIGSPELAAACNDHDFLGTKMLRYIYRRDVVPHLPPMISGSFAHFGREFAYSGVWPWTVNERPTGQMGSLLGLVEAPVAFIARQLRVIREIPFRYSFNDHGPQHYISSLTAPGVASEFGDP